MSDLFDAIASRIEAQPAHHRPTPDFRPAAVLMLLVPRPGGLFVPMIERPTTMAAHGGQIAFPGGRLEPDDRDLAEAALRETEEEVGIPRDAVRLLGALGHFPIPVSRFDVVACVGTWVGDTRLVPDATEVVAAFEVTFSTLLEQHAKYFAGRRYGPREYPEYIVTVDGTRRRIWGATARILHYFIDTIYCPVAG